MSDTAPDRDELLEGFEPDVAEYPTPAATPAASPKANAPKIQVIDRKLYFQPEPDFETGETPKVIVVPLAMRTKTYRLMAESTVGGMEQLFEFVFKPLGIDAQVDELDMIDTTLLVNSWFEKFAELQEASGLGE